MTKRGKIAGIVFAVIVIGLAAVPVETEYHILSAKRFLQEASSVRDCEAKFGSASHTANADLKVTLAERLSLKVADTDDILVFQREGIPYWAIYLVTPDGQTVTDSAVDRFW